jgi:hypothetical protein
MIDAVRNPGSQAVPFLKAPERPRADGAISGLDKKVFWGALQDAETRQRAFHLNFGEAKRPDHPPSESGSEKAS